ncbi:uncharacterized protein LOC122061568 isoform X1 [Macadamia integrifolia]|uniref:uncharacterized protein LOC122061568 isoform X1 n=1 Tax=Macadamia integrifolia TaxID=60698 RepID=UPI001C52FBDE|nr:uncharacterized protein LOC122061568 isoform X1 [Macadamia integrifolia]
MPNPLPLFEWGCLMNSFSSDIFTHRKLKRRKQISGEEVAVQGSFTSNCFLGNNLLLDPISIDRQLVRRKKIRRKEVVEKIGHWFSDETWEEGNGRLKQRT